MKISITVTGLILFVPFVVATPTFAQEGSDRAALEVPSSPIDFAVVQALDDGFKVSQTVKEVHTREEAFTVNVPYTETVGGKQVNRTRAETRVPTIPTVALSERTMQVPAVAVSFSSVTGKKIVDMNVVKKVLAQPRAAVVRYDSQPLEPYFQSVLQSNLVVMHLDRGKLDGVEPKEEPEISRDQPEPKPKRSLDALFN